MTLLPPPSMKTPMMQGLILPRKSTIRVELPPHVHCVRARGRPYYYFQKRRNTKDATKAIRLPDDPRKPEWWEAYRALANEHLPTISANAISQLIKAYKASPEWKQLKPSTKEGWSIYLTRIDTAWGKLETRGIQPKNVLKLRDNWANKPATANATMRCMSSLFSWSVPRGWRDDNPCREIKPLKTGDGYSPWPDDMLELAQKEMREDLWWAAALALYSGQREADCIKMTWADIKDGVMHVVQGKTGKKVWVPVHTLLRPVLASIPKRATTVLTSSEGTPWTLSGFKSAWRKDKPKALAEGGFVFHGLRKSAVVRLLEAGCTTAEVQAITGQSMEMVEHYAKEVNQRKLAAAGMKKWENATATAIVKPLVKPADEAGAK